MAKSPRLNFEFPPEEMTCLKIVCAKLNMTIKDFCTWKIISAVKEQEEKFGFERTEKEKIKWIGQY